jgi:hypothetical protein
MTDKARETIETPHGVAVLIHTCKACGQPTVNMAETRAEQWAHELHANFCCGSAVACKDADCWGHSAG